MSLTSETSVRKDSYLLRKNPEERGSQLLGGGSLKSRVVPVLNIGDNGKSPCGEYGDVIIFRDTVRVSVLHCSICECSRCRCVILNQ